MPGRLPHLPGEDGSHGQTVKPTRWALFGLPNMSPKCLRLGERTSEMLGVRLSAKSRHTARGGKASRFSDESNLDRIREECVTPFV